MHDLKHTITAALLAGILSICPAAQAITPDAYLEEFTSGANAFSTAKSWKEMLRKLDLTNALLFCGDDSFMITDGNGRSTLETEDTRLSISGSLSGGNIEKLSISVSPVDGATDTYQYQAFNLSEIAFDTYVASESDMSDYLFLYDIYPYPMWAASPAVKDGKKSVTSAIGSRLYSVSAKSHARTGEISLTVENEGSAGEEARTQATDNLYANYALESLISLVYELEACGKTCSDLLNKNQGGDALEDAMTDIRSCADAYPRLNIGAYGKLSSLAGKTDPLFAQLSKLAAIDAGAVTSGDLESIVGCIDAIVKALG